MYFLNLITRLTAQKVERKKLHDKDMEANTILNSFVVAANQYAASQTEQNLLHLQRQLDIILGFCSPEQDFLSDPSQMFVTEFFTALINILLDGEIKPALVQRVLSLLLNIVKNEIAEQALRSSFHLHSALSVFLQNHGNGISMRDPLVVQCLQLLEVVTYGVNISIIESNMENLLSSFIKTMVENKTDEALLPVLHILSNLCRRNAVVQSYICSLPNIREIFKELVSKLCSSNSNVVVYTLSTLASLSLNNDMEDKFFSVKQVMKTFQLIVNVLVTNELGAQTAALDLFTDLIERQKLQPYFVRHPELLTIFQRILNVCSSDVSLEEVGGYLKFLLSFMEIPESQQMVLSVLCTEPRESKDEQIYGNYIHPLLLESAKETVEDAGDAPIFALRLIKYIIELLPCGKLQQIDGSIKDLLQVLIGQMATYLNFDSRFLMKQIQRDVALFDIIHSMCKNPYQLNFICQHLDINKCHEIINLQLEHNPLSLKEHEWSEAGVDLVLLTIGVVIAVKDYIIGAKDVLNMVLTEPRLMPFVATSLSSVNKDRVFRGLQTIFVCSKVEQFPAKTLGESIAATNSSRNQQKQFGSEPFVSNTDVESSQCSFMAPMSRASLCNRRLSIDRNVQNLIQKIETGLDLRELKSSEIMEMYEHKIAALTMKEQELQTFVQAKSVALQQADRLLNQYKCRQAQREAEALKLRSLLKESERRSEVAQEQSKKAIQKQLQLQRDLEKAHQDITALEQFNDEQKEAMVEQSQRLSAVQKNLENLQIEHHSVSEMHSMLQRHSEAQKQKLDLMAQHLGDMEKEKNNLVKQLKEKDSKLKDLGKQLQKAEETLKKKEMNIKDLEESREVLTKDAQRSEKRVSRLEQEKSSLELLCQQHEASLEEKESRIKSLVEELERQTHLTDMIHEITSGKINKNSFASLLTKDK